ncbi:MAG: vWA domain-containing protein [Nannocystaceae bacterium]|nr:VWA domain-containing protein [bacterium]
MFLALGLVAVPIVAAYLHRQRRRRQEVSSALLFRVIAGENTPTKRALARPRHLFSLIAVLLAVLALIAAAADFQRETSKPRDWIIVLDTSASMGATVLGADVSRLDEARDTLADALASMGPGDRVALVTAGAATAVQIGLTEDHGAVMDLAAGVTADGSSEALPRALAIADAMATGDDAEIVLLTDGVGVSIPSMRRAPQVHTVGSAGPNLGINALAVREADALGLAEVFLSVTSNVGSDREVEVVLQVDDTVVDVLPLTVPSRSAAEHLHRVALPEGARIRATLQNHGDDVLSLDDVASTPRAEGERVGVVLVSRTRVSFTAEALRLHPRVDLRVLGPFDVAPSETADLLILEADYRAGPLPPARAVLAMGIDPTPLGVERGPSVPAPDIMRWSFDDPLFRFVDLESIELPRANTLRLNEGMRSMLDSEQGPLAVQFNRDGRDVVVFGFAPHDSDLVLRVGFVNLIANAVEWAAPQAPDDPGAEPPRVLPATESRIDPVRAIPGALQGDFADRPATDSPLWRTLAWVALGLLLLEGLLPWSARALGWARETWGRRKR